MSRNKPGARGPQPLAEKPYALVSLPTKIPRDRPQGHERFQAGTLAGSLNGTIIALSHVHVSSGSLELGERVPLPPTGGRNPDLVKSMVRSGGVPIIPGSSLKGTLRSVVEAISPSCICKTKGRFKTPEGLAECRREPLCVACRIFGAMGYEGNVRISDAPLIANEKGKYLTRIEHTPPLFAPNPDRRGYYDRGKVAGRKLYYHGKRPIGRIPVEVCPETSRFDLSLKFSNLRRAELGLILIAMGLSRDHGFKIKVGGAKPGCFGTISFELTSIVAVDSGKGMYLDFDPPDAAVYSGEALVQFVNETAAAAIVNDHFVSAEQLLRVAEILRYPNDRECPAIPY
jgi:CRISPR/Cas system CSM-associated protein Csm3 (group 7 of RAMP superfamily)